jgi:hypothetical protein
MKIQTIPPRRPYSSCRDSGTPKMISSLLASSLLLQLSFLVLIPKKLFGIWCHCSFVSEP